MNSDEKLELLVRYTNGAATPEERAQVETWFGAMRLPQSDWENMPPEQQQRYMKDLYGDIRQAIRLPKAQVITLAARRKWRMPAAAAAVLAVTAAAFLWWPATQKQPVLTVMNAPAGHLHYLRLPDSSKVWVNAGSQLRYPVTFSGKTRAVYLSGEAYFDVRHEAAHPFIIHTGKVVTTVLGTAFNIKEDPVTHQVTVTVKRGKVSVTADHKKTVVLLPDQQVNMYSHGGTPIVKTVNTANVIAWHGGDMRFDDSTFGEAVQTLEQHYGVVIKFSNDKLPHCRFNGTASADEPLDQVLKVLCAFNNSTFTEQKDGSVLISGEGCQP